MVNANLFAQLLLFMWLPLSIVVASMMPREKALVVIFFGGTLFLPERLFFDFPVVPPIEKVSISGLSALVACWIMSARPGEDRRIPFATKAFGGAMVVGAICTALTNGDPVRFGIVKLPSMGLYDGVSLAIGFVMRIVLPYFLGQVLIKKPEHLKTLLVGMIVASLIYAPLVLFETRMSPQLNRWVYGFFQHSWRQMIRGDGFRAIVFMAHGLAVAFFMSQSLIALAGVGPLKGVRLPLPKFLAVLILIVCVISCKSMASMIYATIAAPVMWIGGRWMQFSLARVLALLVLAYPFAILYDLVQTDRLVEFAASYDVDRAQSLGFRFNNEHILLDRASEKFFFGWGGFTRNRIFDPVTGRDLTVVDGEWILRIGNYGFWNFLTFFGALLLPIFRAHKACKFADPQDQRVLATMAMLLALSGVDLLPNSLFQVLPLLFAGALQSTSDELIRVGKLRRETKRKGRAALSRAALSPGVT